MANNIIDERYIYTWKIIDGKLQIKGRLTLRGFKDVEQQIETFAGTASRAGQRLINFVVAQNPEWVFFSYDVSQAFAKGLTFEQYARLTGNPLRKVQLELKSPEDIALFRTLPGWSDFDPKTEVISLLKPVYGLKDAPRAWRLRLHEVLREYSLNSLLAEPEIYVGHCGL